MKQKYQVKCLKDVLKDVLNIDLPKTVEKSNKRRGDEHRQIWAMYNQKLIPKGHFIHHINCNPYDNRPDNLQCVTREQHDKIHAEIRRVKRLN